MASRKQLEANRRNAKRSTGPRSQAGKARSRLNSRKHGLTAKMLVIGGEDADQFEELRGELMQQHDPQTALECELVERLSGLLWRLRRVPFFEAAIIDARQSQVAEETRSRQLPAWEKPGDETDEHADEMSDEDWSVHIGRALIKDGVWNDALGKLARHEATLMSAFTKTLQMLLLLQSNHAKPGRRVDDRGSRRSHQGQMTLRRSGWLRFVILLRRYRLSDGTHVCVARSDRSPFLASASLLIR
jgi:hypothetical protein